MPLWEKKFCTLIGSVSWQKVVDTQKFMYSNSVLSWDDSAGKEAFQNAKERFWARINGFPCEISIPDPDIYIDKIDWNPDIAPELIKDLESVYFAPDEGEKDVKVGRRNKRLRYLASRHGNSGSINPWECNNNKQDGGALEGKTQSWNQLDKAINDLKNINNNDNPWESNITGGNDVVKDKIQGWKQLDENNQNNDAKKLNNDDNPWELSFSQGNEAVKKNTWGNDGDKLWVWNRGVDHVNPWDRSRQGVDAVKDNGGWGDSGNNSWCWSQQKSWNLDSGDDPWKRNFTKCTRHPEDTGFKDGRGSAWDGGWRNNGDDARDRGWRNNGDDTWGWKQRDNHNNEPKHMEFGRSDGNWEAWNGSFRKREGSQLTSYKSSGNAPDYNRSGQCWRSRNANKRVQFCT